MNIIDSPPAQHDADWSIGVEELDEFTVPILDLVTGLLNSILGFVGSLLGGLGL